MSDRRLSLAEALSEVLDQELWDAFVTLAVGADASFADLSGDDGHWHSDLRHQLLARGKISAEEVAREDAIDDLRVRLLAPFRTRLASGEWLLTGVERLARIELDRSLAERVGFDFETNSVVTGQIRLSGIEVVVGPANAPFLDELAEWLRANAGEPLKIKSQLRFEAEKAFGKITNRTFNAAFQLAFGYSRGAPRRNKISGDLDI